MEESKPEVLNERAEKGGGNLLTSRAFNTDLRLSEVGIRGVGFVKDGFVGGKFIEADLFTPKAEEEREKHVKAVCGASGFIIKERVDLAHVCSGLHINKLELSTNSFLII